MNWTQNHVYPYLSLDSLSQTREVTNFFPYSLPKVFPSFFPLFHPSIILAKRVPVQVVSRRAGGCESRSGFSTGDPGLGEGWGNSRYKEIYGNLKWQRKIIGFAMKIKINVLYLWVVVPCISCVDLKPLRPLQLVGIRCGVSPSFRGTTAYRYNTFILNFMANPMIFRCHFKFPYISFYLDHPHPSPKPGPPVVFLNWFIHIFIYLDGCTELGLDWLVGWLLGNKTMAPRILSLHLLWFSPLQWQTWDFKHETFRNQWIPLLNSIWSFNERTRPKKY